MSKKTNNYKEKIRKKIIEEARNYDKNLLNRCYLYAYDAGYIEIEFTKSCFRHLTGVDSNINAETFYDNAVKGTLQNYMFTILHNQKTINNKMINMKNLQKIAEKQTNILIEVSTQNMTYERGIGDQSSTLLLHPSNKAKGKKIDTNYVPSSLRGPDKNIKGKAKDNKDVKFILTKSSPKVKYSKITYISSQNEMKRISKEIKRKMDKCLICNIYRKEISYIKQLVKEMYSMTPDTPKENKKIVKTYVARCVTEDPYRVIGEIKDLLYKLKEISKLRERDTTLSDEQTKDSKEFHAKECITTETNRQGR